MNSPSCSGSIVCIISCNRPWRNFAPVCVLPAVPPLLLPVAPAPLLDPGGPERVSEAARDVTEPPGCVAIDVSDEFAALPCDWWMNISLGIDSCSNCFFVDFWLLIVIVDDVIIIVVVVLLVVDGLVRGRCCCCCLEFFFFILKEMRANERERERWRNGEKKEQTCLCCWEKFHFCWFDCCIHS